MNAAAADFTDLERDLICELLYQRYLKPVWPELADSELQLDPASDELTVCPTLFWSERGASFVVCKVAEQRFRCQFFYADDEQYGTGRPEYDDLRDCVLTLLRVQADHEKQSAGVSSGASAIDLAKRETDDDYHGPVVI